MYRIGGRLRNRHASADGAAVVKSEQMEHEAVAEKRPKRLFTTNTGAC